MFRRPVKEINAEFMAEERFLGDIRRIARESCTAASLSRKDTQAVLLAIEEGATNIIRHAYLYEKGVIRLRIVVFRKLIVFSLIDSGRSFSPEGSNSLDLDHLVESGRKGGLGFYMIKKIMDSVEYITVGGSNELRMIKRISPLKASSRPFLRRLFTLRVKFSFWSAIIMIVIIGGSFYFLDFRTTRLFKSHLDDTVRSLAETIADQAAGYLINRRTDVEFDQLIVSYLRANPELRLIVLTDSTGLVTAHSEDIKLIRRMYDVPDEIDSSVVASPQPYQIDNEQLNYLMMAIPSGHRSIGTVHIVYSAREMESNLRAARIQNISLILILISFGMFAIYLLSNYFVRPIADITHRVRRFTAGDIETELPLEGAEEFFEISKAFNQMTTRLSRDRKNIISREKLAKEIEVAAQIQQTLLPKELPYLPDLEVEAFYRAASMVGGDLYDVFEIAENRFCMVVADVSGKGVPASLVMSMLRTVIRIFAVDSKSSRATLVRVNDYLLGNIPPGMFITVMLAIYDTKSGRMKFSSAGHNPMMLYKAATKEILKLNPAGMPLGIQSTLNGSFEDCLEEKNMTIETGDLFFMFTDGLSEATDGQGEQYGLDRLFDFVGRKVIAGEPKTLAKLVTGIVEEIDAYSGYAPQTDDISLVIARRGTRLKQSTGRDQEPIKTQKIPAGKSKQRKSN